MSIMDYNAQTMEGLYVGKSYKSDLQMCPLKYQRVFYCCRIKCQPFPPQLYSSFTFLFFVYQITEHTRKY